MENGIVRAICLATEAGKPMQEVFSVMAIAGQGLEGDRYCTGQGSWSDNTVGKRQVTLINGIFFPGTDFGIRDARRNIITEGVELMYLIGHEFPVGGALFRGVKYCDSCARPSKLSGIPGFAEAFHDRGGLVAEVLKGGLIEVNCAIISPKKNYD